jgi:hypothetical protein
MNDPEFFAEKMRWYDRPPLVKLWDLPVGFGEVCAFCDMPLNGLSYQARGNHVIQFHTGLAIGVSKPGFLARVLN